MNVEGGGQPTLSAYQLSQLLSSSPRGRSSYVREADEAGWTDSDLDEYDDEDDVELIEEEAPLLIGED